MKQIVSKCVLCRTELRSENGIWYFSDSKQNLCALICFLCAKAINFNAFAIPESIQKFYMFDKYNLNPILLSEYKYKQICQLE